MNEYDVFTRAVDLIALTRAINALKKFAIKIFNALIACVNLILLKLNQRQ